MHESLRGRRVVIIGGTSGMGRGAARAAAAEGAEVVVAGRRALAARDAVEGQFRQVVVDMTDERSVGEAFEQIGELDHLFVTATPGGDTGAFLTQDLARAQR